MNQSSPFRWTRYSPRIAILKKSTGLHGCSEFLAYNVRLSFLVLLCLMPWLSHAASNTVLYETSFEAPAFTPGLPIRGQDNWSMFHDGEALSIVTNNAYRGTQCLKIDGSLLEQVGPNFARSFAFSRALETNASSAAIVEIRATVRLDGPQTGMKETPEQDLISANLFATVSFTASSAATLGGFFVSSAGRIWTYGGDGQDAYKYSTAYTLGTYRTLVLRVDFVARRLTYLVDGIELGSSEFAAGVTADRLYSGYLELAGALDPIHTPELTFDPALYSAYFDDYSLVSVPLSPVNAVIEFASTNVISDEWRKSVSLNIIRRGFTAAAVRVAVRTEEDSAKAGEDYVGLTNYVRFGPGETSQTVDVELAPDDAWPEPDKAFHLRIVDLPPGATSPKSLATVYIRDDERPGSIDASWVSDLGLPSLNTPEEYYAIPEIISTLPDGRMLLQVAVMDQDFVRAAYFRFVRIHADGSLDTSYEVIESRVATQQVTRAADGSFLVTSRSKESAAPSVFDYRLNPDGTVDGSFKLALSGTIGFTLIPQQDGKILVNGESQQNVMILNGQRMPAIFRLNEDGTLDRDFNAPKNLAGSLRLISDGRLYLSSNYAPPYRLYRLNSDGSLDSSFVAPSNQDLTIVSFLSNGDILAYSFAAQQYQSIKLYRLHADGSLPDGYSVSTATGQPHVLFSFVEQSDGKIVLSGVFSRFNGEAHNSIVRIDADGKIDPTFRSGTGFTQGNPKTAGQIYLTARSDGSMVVSGSFDQYNGENVSPPILLNADGTWNRDARQAGSIAEVLGGGSYLPALFLNGEFLGSPSFGTDTGVFYATGKGLGRIRTQLPLRIVSMSLEENSIPHLLANALPGKSYTLQSSEGLGPWLDLKVQQATTNRIEFTDSQVTKSPMRLYRVREN